MALWAGALGLAVAAVLLAAAWRAHALSFPLDDAWIHLTYARNLAERGTFAYSPGETSTQGSTSPLFTLLLAFGFLVTSNEKALGIGLGLAAHAGFLVALALWARSRLGPVGAALAVAIVALDANVAILSVSGMETSLFLLWVAGALLARASDRPRLEGAAVGLAVWTRPEGLVLGVVLLVDHLLERPAGGRSGGPVLGTRRAELTGLAIVVLLAGAWIAFNLVIGGSPLPNTFAAKTRFYAEMSRGEFLTADVREAFARGAWIVVTPLALAGASREVVRLARWGGGRVRAEIGWAASLVLAYLVLLPFGHRFERYLVPALPAIAVSGLAMAEDAFTVLRSRISGRAAVALCAVVVLAAGWAHLDRARGAPDRYVTFSRYHLNRHERTGRWLASHTPSDAVVATHDVGAIGFYARRRIVDTVGVVLPEVVRHVDTPEYLDVLRDLFRRKGVTQLAVLRNWLRVANVEPLFLADPEPEILEVYPWVEGRTHLVPRQAARLEFEAVDRLKEGSPEAALRALDRAVAIDPDAAPAWLLRGQALEIDRRLDAAEASYRRAAALAPDSPEARFRLAVVTAALGRRDEALAIVREVLRLRPDHPRAADLLRALERDAGGARGRR